MAYKSPIELIADDIHYHVRQATEQTIFEAVQHYFPLINEEELAKALKYDRDQYVAGFIDGRAARDAEIVRCKDCVYGHLYLDVQNEVTDSWIKCRNPDGLNRDVPVDGFCSASIRRKEETE